MSSLSRIDSDVKKGFSGLEKVNSILCSCGGATEDVRVVYELTWWLRE